MTGHYGYQQTSEARAATLPCPECSDYKPGFVITKHRDRDRGGEPFYSFVACSACDGQGRVPASQVPGSAQWCASYRQWGDAS